jgi:hypothetical protein
MSRPPTNLDMRGMVPAYTSGQLPVQRAGWLMREKFGAPVLAHIAFLALSVVLWGWSYQQLTEEITVENRASLQLSFPDGNKRWAVVSRPSERLSLSVSGPKERIDRFQAEVTESRGRAVFTYEVPAEALSDDDSETRIELAVALGDFGPITGVGIPDQVQVRFSEPESKVVFVLERVMIRPAAVDWSGVSQSLAWQLSAKVKQPLSVRGPVGRLNELTQPDGRVTVRVKAYDLMRELEGLARGADSARREEIFREEREIRLGLVPIEGLEFLSPHPDGGLVQVSEVVAGVSMVPSARYQPLALTLDVSYLFPAWMNASGVKMEPSGNWQSLVLELLVNSAQLESAQSAGVRLVCDLTQIQRTEGVRLTGVAGPDGNLRDAFVIDPKAYPVRLEVTDRSRFDFRIPQSLQMDGKSESRIAEVTLGFRWFAE